MGNPFKRLKIDYVVFGCFASVITVSLVLAIYWSYTISSKELASASSKYQSELLGKVNRQIHSELRIIESASLAAYRFPDLDFFDSRAEPFKRYNAAQEYKLYLRNLVYSMPALYTIDVYMESPPVTSEQQDFIHMYDLERLRSEPYYRQIERADFVWIGDHSYGDRQARVISFARKMFLSSGEYLGVIVFHLKTTAIQALMRDEDNSQRLLLDEAGRYVASVGMTEAAARRVQAQFQVLPGAGGGSERLGDDMFVWDRFVNSSWTLVEVTPWHAVTAGSLEIAKALLAIVAATLLAALVLAFVLARNLIRPLRILVTAMNRYAVSKERASPALPDDYTNEFGSLFAGYRRLIERIEELYASLKERYRKQKEAELQALQSNMNPHFLYNTLDQLNWMAVDIGADDISEVLEWMGRMFRIGLSNGATFITVERELEHVRCYSEIIRLRTKGRVVLRMQVPEELLACCVPKIILQPFVENAVVHAFAKSGRGTVTISGERVEDALVLRVEDDGLGLPADWRKPRMKSGGYGIRNVEQRIEALFGDGYGVALRRLPDGRPGSPAGTTGTRVDIRLPLLRASDGGEKVPCGKYA